MSAPPTGAEVPLPAVCGLPDPALMIVLLSAGDSGLLRVHNVVFSVEVMWLVVCFLFLLLIVSLSQFYLSFPKFFCALCDSYPSGKEH